MALEACVTSRLINETKNVPGKLTTYVEETGTVNSQLLYIDFFCHNWAFRKNKSNLYLYNSLHPGWNIHYLRENLKNFYVEFVLCRWFSIGKHGLLIYSDFCLKMLITRYIANKLIVQERLKTVRNSSRPHKPFFENIKF